MLYILIVALFTHSTRTVHLGYFFFFPHTCLWIFMAVGTSWIQIYSHNHVDPNTGKIYVSATCQQKFVQYVLKNGVTRSLQIWGTFLRYQNELFQHYNWLMKKLGTFECPHPVLPKLLAPISPSPQKLLIFVHSIYDGVQVTLRLWFCKIIIHLLEWKILFTVWPLDGLVTYPLHWKGRKANNNKNIKKLTTELVCLVTSLSSWSVKIWKHIWNNFWLKISVLN